MAKLLRELNLNDTIKFGRHQVNEEEPWDLIWRIAAKNHQCEPAYPTNSVTLITDKTIDRRAMDASEPDNPDSWRQMMGSNRFIQSNLLQWLNSDSEPGEWYTKQHEYDMPPDAPERVSGRLSHYAHRAGFQKFFTQKEKDSILETTLTVTKNIEVDGGGYDIFTTKIFPPSNTEMGYPDYAETVEGARWEIFTDHESRATPAAPQAYENTLSASKPFEPEASDQYWLRTAEPLNTPMFLIATGNARGVTQARDGATAVRPALNLADDLLVSDEPDADGCYTVIFDDPPELAAVAQGELGVLSKAFNIAYTVSDPDDDPLTVTEYLNGEVIRSLTEQTSGARLSFDLTPQWQSLDLDTPYTALLEVSDGILTTTRAWTFTRSNAAPSITATESGDLGKLAVPLNRGYVINDTNSDLLTVTESLDGQVIRSLTDQPSGSILMLDLTDRWEALSKDSTHTVEIEISDGLETAARTWSFSIIEPIRQGITVSPSSVQPTGVIIPVLPVEVLVTNNAGDAEPFWEDASKEYLERKQYSFKNSVKTADEWCVGIKYNVNGVSIPVNLTTVHKFDLS